MPQAIAAAAAWVGSTVMTAVGTTLTATGVTAAIGGASALGIAHGVAMFAYTVSEIALWAGMSYAVDAATKPKLKPPGSELQFNMDPAYPREMIIGQRLVGGSMVARYSRGSNLYNAHMVIQVADHPCVELSKVYDAGRVVRDTPLTHGTRTEITAYSNSGGARVWMTWWDGRPGQTADTDLITKSAQDPDVVAGKLPGWSSEHVGAGCAYIHVEVQWDSDILTSIPQFTWLVKGARLYDRRKDTTAGGSGSHRLDDPSTWEYTDNAAVAADHYLLGYKVEDDDLAFGIGLHPSEVPYAIFANAADLADEDVETGTGDDVETIKRYVVNGVVSAAEYFEDVLEAFQMQMAGRFVDLGGRIGFLGAEEREISLDLSDQDLTSDDQMQFADKLSFDDLYGSASGTFADPANLYQQTPFETQYTPYQALPDGGEAQQIQLSLPYEIHPRRAVRNVAAWLNRESLQPRLVGVFMAVAWALEPGDWFTFTSERLQLDMAKFEVIDIAKNDDFTVMITARAIDPEFLAFSVDNDPDLSVPPDVDPVSLLLDEPEFDVEVSTLVAGGVVEPCLEFTLTSDETVSREIVVEYGKWDGADIEGPTLVDSFHVSQIVTKLRKGVLPSTSYKVRAKSKAGNRESLWTDWSTVITTGATYAVGSAASVPWSGVTDSGGRPDDNADVTSANTAAAIAGQGWGATASEANASNAYVPAYGVNLLRSTRLTSTAGWAVYDNTGLSPVLSAQVDGDGEPYIQALATGSPTAATLFDIYNSSANPAGVIAGQRYEISADVFGSLSDGVPSLLVIWLDSAGAYLTQNALDSTATTAAWVRLGGFATAPAGAAFGVVNARYTMGASASDPGMLLRRPMIALARTGQTALSPYARGAEAELGSDVTSAHTAAAFAGQGALATLSSLAYGGGYLTGFAALAAKATIDSSSLVDAGVIVYTALASTAVRLGTNITRSDGSTSLTDALAVTSLGTAAAIASQGALATLGQVNLGASGRVYRDDGTTRLTDALAVTALGTAAAFTGQGALATLNTINSSGLMGAGVVTYTALASTAVRLGTNIVRADGTTSATDALLVTSLGTASAIASQGALATSALSEIGVRNDAIGGQLFLDPDFMHPTSYIGVGGSSSSNFSRVAVASAPAGPYVLETNSTAGLQWYARDRKFRIDKNKPYELEFYARKTSGNELMYAAIEFFDENGTLITGETLSGWPGYYAPGGLYYFVNGVAPSSSWTRYTAVMGAVGHQVPASAAYASFGFLFNFSGGGGTPGVNQIQGLKCRELVRVGTNLYRADGTVASEAQLVTSLGTASAITSQGGLATLSFVTISTNLRLADGTTIATTAMVVTASGTAAAIASQGGLATQNTVGTSTIDANSVTVGAVEENDAAQSVDENWTALADVSVTVPSSATLVKLDWSFFIASSGEAEDDLLVRIKRDSTVIYETTAARVPPVFEFETTETGPVTWQGYAVGQFSGFDTDAPSAGTYTYTLEAKSAYSTTTSWSLEKRRLFALLFKR